MKGMFYECVGRIFAARKKHRRFINIMLILSVLAAVDVFWMLHRIGIAMTDEFLCGKTEHVHSAECLSDINECKLEEHIHTAECTSDISADAETEEVWLSALPEDLSDNWRDNMAAIALSQVGYRESEKNFTVNDRGERNGYTRYGQWYGNPYGDWNTMFVYFCMYYAGIDTDDIPYGSGCQVWAENLAENGMFIPADIGRPLNGDVCFLDIDKDGITDRTAIVTGSEKNGSEIKIQTAEGDIDGEVVLTSYIWGDEHIIGFLSLEQPDMISSGNSIEYSCSPPENNEDISDDEYTEIRSEEYEDVLGISDLYNTDRAYSAYMDNINAYLANEDERCVYLNNRLNGTYSLHGSTGNTVVTIKSGQKVDLYVKLYLKKSETDNSHPYNFYVEISESEYNEHKNEWNYFKHGDKYYHLNASIWNITDDGSGDNLEEYDSEYISYSSFYFQSEGNEEIIMYRQTITGLPLDAGSSQKRYAFVYNRCGNGAQPEIFYIRVAPTDINIINPDYEPNTYLKKEGAYKIARDNSITLYAVADLDKSNYTVYPDESAFNQAKEANSSDANLCFLKTSTGEYISTYTRFENRGYTPSETETAPGGDPRLSMTYAKYVSDGAKKKLMITVTYKVADDNRPDAEIGLSNYSVIKFYNNSKNEPGTAAEYMWLDIMPSENINDGSEFNIKISQSINEPCSNYGAGNPYGSDGSFKSRSSITLQCVTPYFEKISESDYNDLPANKRDLYKKVTDTGPNNENRFFYIKTEANIWSNNVNKNANGEIVDTLVTKGTVTYEVKNNLLYVDIIYTAKDVIDAAGDAKITYFSGIPVSVNHRERYFKYFYLRVSERTYTADYPIYVKTAGGVWKDKDMITEYNPDIGWLVEQNRDNGYGYISNTDIFPYINYVENETESHDDSFYVNENMAYSKLELYFPKKYTKSDTNRFVIAGISYGKKNAENKMEEIVKVENAFPDSGGVKVLLGEEEKLQKGFDTNGDGTEDAIYRCYYINSNYLNNTFRNYIKVKIDFKSGGDVISSIFVKLYPRGEKNSYNGDDGLTHCDIEIEEGGLYTFDKRKVDPDNGQVYDVIESYEAVISGVKGCKVYDKNGNPVKFFLETEQTYNEAADAEFIESDYVSSGIKGSTQFEFTSAFYPETDENGNKVSRSEYFLKKDVYRVDFVVQITLTPYKRTTIVYKDRDRTIIDTDKTRQDSFGGKPLIVNDVAISMDQKSISDALNKCPLHNGLDFTYVGDLKQAININDSNTSVKVYKKLENGEIQKDQFSFLITDLLTGDEFIVKNRALSEDVKADIAEQGLTLVQLMQRYTDEGIYSFTIREIIPENTEGIAYCKDVYQMDVIVTYDDGHNEDNEKRFRYTAKYYDSEGVQIPSIPVFVNTVTLYELPSTGGMGTTIYYVTGGVLIIVPVLILIRRKRKER